MQSKNTFYFALVFVFFSGFVSCEEQAEKAPCCTEEQGWSPWGPWSECSKSCGNGDQIRARTCHQGPGVACPGYALLSKPCNLQPCPRVNGRWSTWGDWGECSATCGGGSQQRMRTCTSPPPSSGGSRCIGTNMDKQECSSNGCPVDGGWGPWSDWSSCSASCGDGRRFRVRSCNNPPTLNGGAPCHGTRIEMPGCNNGECQDTVNFERVGCYKDGDPRALPVLLANFRQNMNWPELHKNVYKCAMMAQQRSWTYFAIQYLGICYSGPQADNTFDMYGKTDTCWKGIGETNTNFVYRITD